jgi:hypothetical protein
LRWEFLIPAVMIVLSGCSYKDLASNSVPSATRVSSGSGYVSTSTPTPTKSPNDPCEITKNLIQKFLGGEEKVKERLFEESRKCGDTVYMKVTWGIRAKDYEQLRLLLR